MSSETSFGSKKERAGRGQSTTTKEPTVEKTQLAVLPLTPARSPIHHAAGITASTDVYGKIMTKYTAIYTRASKHANYRGSRIETRHHSYAYFYTFGISQR
jgi:hypothetical protein